MVQLITECSNEVELYESNNKDMYIVGVFSTADVKNANGRKYSRDILNREMEKFVSEKVETKSAFGELSHPNGPDLNLDKVAILIESMEWRGNDLYGKAKVLDTPNGKIVKALMKDGRIGISSRGLGTVSESTGYVNDDFNLLTYDIVADPSNYNSRFVNGILEGKTWDIYSDANTMSIDEAEEEFIKDRISIINKMINDL